MAVGIIAEYNPFHNGHIKQINWVKEHFPGEKIVVVMSDKFSQRGELTVVPFSIRKKYAKKYGVNKVIKLKFEETVQAAHIFAYNAVMKLYKAKVDKIVFGSESNNPDSMLYCAKVMKEKHNEFSFALLQKMKKSGLSYPKAVSEVMKELVGESFEMPNDILGFEYIKVIVYNNLPIKIYTLRREVGYHSDKVVDEFASASYLRKLIYQGQDIRAYSPMTFKKVPRTTASLYWKFQKIMNHTSLKKIKRIPLISEGIENLLKKNITYPTYESFVEACTSKRYTASRIQRIIAWILNRKWKKTSNRKVKKIIKIHKKEETQNIESKSR
ncbi:Protein of uncharacterised function (DUF795) (plasmid) [Mesomycoplasma conjunctivae]|uniref:tRNA(Met) cytidine acetate ligase n=1 Tax=Mycoplasmopsis fermentans (strain M64) TaxID=943945 RepID=A0AB32XBA6_MYCFM|nr:nucleotidyltransferase [Mycoplasmopsis fermentans]ADV34328.1 Conserved Hypothetical Protein [Mycoplasmopsis fermentans M64]VEU60352.1 Protein of uncharacterised function (DUF795) [Mycoplasmopsis fermentans]VEU67494.1 Protein of uncharacterised function (DUF795) [Mesomycoplasma conjunctivae]